MPSRLSMTMTTLDVRNNDISLIRSSSNYNYCINCSIMMTGNPWVCDEMMIRMIIWATRNGAKLLLDANCDQTNPNGNYLIISYKNMRSIEKSK